MRPEKVKLAAKHLGRPLDVNDRIQWDSEVPGFGLRTRRMKKWGSDALSNQPPRETWIFQYGSRRITIGLASAMKPQAARDIAFQHYAKVRQGIDPQAEKAQAVAKAAEGKAKAANTFAKLGQDYLEAQQGELRPSTFDAQSRYLLKHAATLHGLPVDSINLRAIDSLLSDVAKNKGRAASNRLRQTLSRVFSWGMRRGDVATNPVALTEKLKEKSRDRILSPAELKLVWQSLPANEYGTIVKVLMLTGQRLSEIARLRGFEVDFQRGLISLPGDRTKNSRPHEVPMSPMVRSLLASAPRNGRETLFPTQMYDRRKKALDAAIAKANGGEPIPAWVHHDLRRTCATGMADIGVLPHIIEAVLNHISGHKAGVAGIYNRAAYSAEKRDALTRWDAHVAKIVS